MTAGEDAAIREALCVCFPPDREVFARTRSWHGTYPTWSVVVTEGEKVIAHAGVVEREIAAGEERVAVAGIQNVLVMPEHRGKQLFRRMMTVAMDEALGRDLDLGLLFCTPEIGRLYTKLDWRQATGRRVVCAGRERCPRDDSGEERDDVLSAAAG